MDRVTPKTKIALVDHVTSPTGAVFPIADIVKALVERGVDTLVDGAHAPGMLPLNLPSVAPCGPKRGALGASRWRCASRARRSAVVMRRGIRPC